MNRSSIGNPIHQSANAQAAKVTALRTAEEDSAL